MEIELGKINKNKAETIISEIEWKGKSREEHRSYLEYSTGEYKESKTVLTKPFGDVEEKATLFLDALNKKYITITEINFKEFMQEAQTFCDNYEYKKVNLVKTKEELLAERADNKKRTEEAEKEKKEKDAKVRASGNLTTSDKINLGTKEIAKQIREKLKKFNDCVFSVTKKTNSINIYLMKSSLKVVRDFDDLSEEVIHRYLDDGLRTKEQLKEMQTSGHCQLSKYTFRDDYNPDTWNNGIFLTKEGHKLFGEVVKIVQYYNYDHSDSMIDYFDTNFYLHLCIGKWDNKYVFEEKVEQEEQTNNNPRNKVTFKKNEEKNGLEIYFPEKPSSSVRDILKSKGFRWGKFNKCWYKRFSDGLEEDIKQALEV